MDINNAVTQAAVVVEGNRGRTQADTLLGYI